MAAGLAALGQCFPTAAAAASYACGAAWPVASIDVSAGQPVTTYCASSSDSTVTLQLYRGATLVSTKVQTVAFGACDTSDWQTFYPFSMSTADGAAVAAAVAGVWCIAWAAKAVLRALNSAGGTSAETSE